MSQEVTLHVNDGPILRRSITDEIRSAPAVNRAHVAHDELAASLKWYMEDQPGSDGPAGNAIAHVCRSGADVASAQLLTT